jgi:L-lysine epsilon oxidase-like protein
MYGKGCPMDFDNDAFIAKLATKPDPTTKVDPYAELRQAIYNSFRPPQPTVNEPVVWPHVWPWIYGDAFGSFPANGPGNMLTMTGTQATLLRRWVDGDVEIDWPSPPPPDSLDKVPLAKRPAMLDQSALHFCLADTFHPGCELTWPMRHPSIYSEPFRIRHRPAGVPEPDFGPTLTQQIALQVDGPVYAQGPGDLTRWMALPWQGDTAFCRSGYDPQYDPYVPTFWAARVPNQVLTEEDYLKVIDTTLPREERIAAFNHRALWLRAVDGPVAPQVMMRMIAEFGALGIVEARKGVQDDPDFPETMFVETLGASHLRTVAMQVSAARAAPPQPLTRVERAGWSSDEHFREFRAIRVRHE